MDTRDAFNFIISTLTESGVEIIDALYDEEKFGNFLISYVIDGEENSIVCDRGEVVVCEGLEGSRDCEVLVQRLNEVNELNIQNLIDGPRQ